MSVADQVQPAAGRPGVGRPGGPSRGRPLTIGQVVKQVQAEFPDVSISKIRYLEDRKLLTPKRTSGGYRLFTADDVDRLRAILRMQRDEFLPLRVIRQQLAAGRGREPRLPGGSGGGGATSDESAPRGGPAPSSVRPQVSTRQAGAVYSVERVCEETGAPERLVRELLDFQIIGGVDRGDGVLLDDTEREIVRAATQLADYGVGGRNLRVLRTSADREAALLEQMLGPALRSRNDDRRREAVEALETLAATTTHLKHLMLIRDLRRLIG